MVEYKQVILVRKDLRLPKGKMAAQVAHAAVQAVINSDKKIVSEWKLQGQKKVVLKVEDEKELMKFLMMAKEMNLVATLITDAGRTVIAPGTKTCVGIGPDEEDKINEITGKLGMM